MNKLLLFLRPGTSFDPIQLAALCQAYDKVCATLKAHDLPTSVKEALATEIIAVASKGKFDPNYLADTTLERIARSGSTTQFYAHGQNGETA